MTQRPSVGRGLFYTRDSEGRSELAPPQYVAWAQDQAKRLSVAFTGTPEAIQSMISRSVSAEGDLFLDYGVAGNLLSRPGLDAFRQRALSDTSVSHLFIPRRDRLLRPDNPTDAMEQEYELRGAGLTLVMMDKVHPPTLRGTRIDVADLITCLMEYEGSGKFRWELAGKLIHAKIRLARAGFSIGGEPVYGFRRWLCSDAGVAKRELADHEIVKLPGHHVVWLPTAEHELVVVRRILDLIEATPASRIADILNAEGIPSPKAGRLRKVNGVLVPNSGLWTQNTVRNIASHPLLVAVWTYGRRAEGDQQRMTADGPRPLNDGDYNVRGKLKAVMHPEGGLISAAAKFDPVIPMERHARIKEILDTRGRHQKGKARTHGDAPNPLGGHVYDLNCGWGMYRFARRGRWAYRCGLYQNSEAACCRHNVVPGPAAARFVMASLRQRVLAPTALAKLKARLTELSMVDSGADLAARQRAADEAALATVRRKLPTVSRNMALADTPDELAATKVVFNELKAEEKRLDERIRNTPPAHNAVEPGEQVNAAMAVLDRLARLADASATDYAGIGELVRTTGAKLYLRFREEQRGRQTINFPAGGVLTFGSAPPPGPLYEGPTDKPAIRKRLANGESVSPVPGHGAQGSSEAGQEVRGSANVKRSTMRCT